ncbi:MAG TPA: hypothetical protein VN673_02900, partial [Clostridia bacterium]|nr:hypothetical protein [Clostridia bacterium]
MAASARIWSLRCRSIKEARERACERYLKNATDPNRIAPFLTLAQLNMRRGCPMFKIGINMQKETPSDSDPEAAQLVTEVRREEALLKAGALQKAIFNSANFSSIATDAKGVIQ